MTEAILRDYRPGDWESMYALDLVCFEPVFRFSRRAMQQFAEEPGAIAILAEAAEQLIGFCIVHIEDQVGYIVTLDVAPAWRRLGIAGRLMDEAEVRVRAAGGTGMALHVYKQNAAAIQFYEGLGYDRAGEVPHFYGRGVDALMYRKASHEP